MHAYRLSIQVVEQIILYKLRVHPQRGKGVRDKKEKDMSYDISLMINTGLEEVEVVEVGNYTYNVSPMYYDSMGMGLNSFNDMKCTDAIPILKKGIESLQSNPAKYKEMNPNNGWGNYEGALEYIRNLHDKCVRNPLCKIDVH